MNKVCLFRPQEQERQRSKLSPMTEARAAVILQNVARCGNFINILLLFKSIILFHTQNITKKKFTIKHEM